MFETSSFACAMLHGVTGCPGGAYGHVQTGRPACTSLHRIENYVVSWSEWRDSNPRPLVPQTSALTGLRYTPILALIEKAPRLTQRRARKGGAGRRRRVMLAIDNPFLKKAAEEVRERLKKAIARLCETRKSRNLILPPASRVKLSFMILE